MPVALAPRATFLRMHCANRHWGFASASCAEFHRSGGESAAYCLRVAATVRDGPPDALQSFVYWP
eukprot:870885-Alexandrium_andersonii.AAC.1